LSERIQYKEAFESGTIFNLLIAGAVLLVGYFLMIPYRDETIPRILLLIIIIVLFGVFLVFRKLDIVVIDKRIKIGFHLLSLEVLFSDIEEVEVIDPPFWRYGGLGYRFGLDGSIGYVLNFRKGIRISRENGRDIFFSTNNPDEMATILKKNLS
jgi:hypothetical protein